MEAFCSKTSVPATLRNYDGKDKSVNEGWSEEAVNKYTCCHALVFCHLELDNTAGGFKTRFV